ncbi:MAG TPA: carboxylesterase family protein [Puia sp.]|nr:carboxylesterase family protein [Puia sp.]
MSSNYKILTVLVALLMWGVATFSQANGYPNLIQISGGLISGTSSQDGQVHIYKGIPFAAPPIAGLRWREPQPVQPWTGVRKCINFGPSPMQAKPTPFAVYTSEFLIPASPISEDCLYLNVWTAAKGPNERRPVIVWIYGGGFTSGGSGVPIYDGQEMAKKGIVFVSINYRVGIFGFFALPELTKESDHRASGNYGLMDQIAALKWVKDNIESFGGDPENVTVAGQSAGSISVNCLVASPMCRGLFKRAIAESGAAFLNGMISTPSLTKAEEAGEEFAHSLNVQKISDLRAVSAEDLMKKNYPLRGVIVDGYVLPDKIAHIFATGSQNDVGVITGWNGDDGFLFGKVKNADEFRSDATRQYDSQAGQYLEYFPSSTDQQAAGSQLKLSRDLLFGIQNYTWALVQSEKSKSKIYVYNFNRKVPATPEYEKYGAFHTGEVAYAYDNLSFENRPWRKVDFDLANLMSTYWANFAKTGDPNGSGLPYWPPFDTKSFQTMQFDSTSTIEALPSKAELDFLISRIKIDQELK